MSFGYYSENLGHYHSWDVKSFVKNLQKKILDSYALGVLRQSSTYVKRPYTNIKMDRYRRPKELKAQKDMNLDREGEQESLYAEL